jgi:GxxExxY protein
MINKTEEYKYTDITGKVIGAAMEVHKELSFGYPEIVYQKALAIELDGKLDFTREAELPVYYKDKEIYKRRVDFFVEGKIAVEIKAVEKLLPEHLVQAKNYIENSNLEIGLLLNFGGKSLEFKRLINNKFKNHEHQK